MRCRDMALLGRDCLWCSCMCGPSLWFIRRCQTCSNPVGATHWRGRHVANKL